MLPLATFLLSFGINIRIHYHQLTMDEFYICRLELQSAMPMHLNFLSKEQYKVICVDVLGLLGAKFANYNSLPAIHS